MSDDSLDWRDRYPDNCPRNNLDRGAREFLSLNFNRMRLDDDPIEPKQYKKWNKNWCDMPPEIKAEVIKYVDYKSSVQLRQTARAEKILVDSRKFDFKEVLLTTKPRSGTELIQVTVPKGQKFSV